MRRSKVAEEQYYRNKEVMVKSSSSSNGDLKEKSSKEIIGGCDDGKKKVEEGKKIERKPSEDINASAEAFIKNFRQQLLIQRLQSIENYEQMLARGL